MTTAYLDGELCGVRPDGVTSFELMQQGGEGLTYFAFDLLELDGDDIARLPPLERKKQLAALLRKPLEKTHLMINARHLNSRQSVAIPTIMRKPTVKARRLLTLPPLLSPQRG